MITKAEIKQHNKPAVDTVVNFGVSFLHLKETENIEKPKAAAKPNINPPIEFVLSLLIAMIIIPIAAIMSKKLGNLNSLNYLCGNIGITMNGSHFFDIFNYLTESDVIKVMSFIKRDRNKVKIDRLYTMLELLFLNTPRINNDINDKEINISDVIKFIFSINFYPQNRCLNLHYMSELNCL